MHPDIEKLINIAKEGGKLTEKQKEIILRKAEKLGEDKDEVEMILESIQCNEPAKMGKPKVRKCPHCGATIPATSLKCPECGFLVDDESEAAREARKFIEELQKRLNRYGTELEDEEKKASIIQGATTPNTVEGYSQMLTFAYSNYLSSHRDGDGRPLVKNAWLGKAQHAYAQLQMRAKDDESIQSFLSNYAFVLSEKPAKNYTVYIILGIIIPLAILFYYIITTT